MQCAACNQTNREGARFCDACGAALAPQCASCGTELREGARFCDACGAATEGSATAAPAEPARKTVTVLFADLVGSTAFAEQVDAEVARATLGRYHELAAQVVAEHGGTIAKFIGDGVMVTFGIPEIAEDDALRAIRTGAALQEGFAPIAARALSEHGLSLALRVGINTGEVVVASDDADLVGDAINTAARIEAACAPGSVLIGEQTWRLTRGEFDYQPLEEVTVRGKADPVATYQLLDVTAADNSIAFFVGRNVELEALERVFAEHVTIGESAVVTVIGSPGVGKTRLAHEFRARLGGRATTHDLRLDRSTAATFAPIAALYAEVGADLALRHEVVATLDSFSGDAPARSTEESFWATRQLLEHLAAEVPLVLIIDDIQWAEPLFLELLEYLAEWLQAPVMIVGLARPELRAVSPALSQRGRRVREVIELDGLPPAMTEQLAAQMLGADVLPAELLARLGEATQGNPLFVCELIRMLVDDETLVIDSEGGWQLTIDGVDVDVPPTIQSLLATRIERLPDDERRFIEVASVIGAQFERGAAAALVPDMASDAVDDVIERLRRREIIDTTSTYWADEPVLRFHHVLIRDSAYRRILKESRAELHLQVASWIERAAEHADGHHEIAIANHLSQAHAYRTELGQAGDETDQIGEHCAVLLDTAADRALDQDDLRAAGDLAIRAFQCVSEQSPARSELLLTACEALLSAGAVREAEPLIEEFEQLAADDERLQSWVVAFKGHQAMLGSVAQLSDWEHLVAGAAKLLDELGDPVGVAKARLVRAVILARLGQVGACEEELDRALTAARVADDRRRITSVLGAAPVAALWGPSPVARAGGRCLDVIRLLRITSASPMVEAISIRCQAVLEAMRGRHDRARELIAASRETVEELGLRHGSLETEMFAGIIELLAGDAVAAEPHLRAAMEGLGNLGVGADAGQAAAHLARALLQQGRLDEAEDLADDSDSLAGQNLQTAIASRAVRAEIAAARGSHDEAIALANDAVEIAEETDLTWDHAQALLSLARVLESAGESATGTRDTAATLLEAKGAESATVKSTVPSPAAAPASLGHQWMEAAYRALNDRDLDGHAAMFRPDFVWHERRSGVLETRPVDRMLETIRLGVVHNGLRVIGASHLASRGQLIVLTAEDYSRGDYRLSQLAVAEWDESGKVIRSAAFDPEQTDAAYALLDEWYLESLTPAEAVVFETANRFIGAISRGDVRAIEQLLAEDFESHDHQQLGFPIQNAEQWMRVTTELDEQAAGQELRLISLHHLSASKLIGTFERLSTTEDAPMAAWRQTIAATISNGLITRLDEYGEGDVDLALGQSEASPTNPSAPSAVHVNAALRRHALEGDLESYAALLDTDYWLDDRRQLGAGLMHRDALIDTISHLIQEGANQYSEQEVHATRGDHLVLLRESWQSVEPDSIIPSFDYLLVSEVADGRCVRAVQLEVDRIDAAYELLDEWYLQSLATQSANTAQSPPARPPDTNRAFAFARESQRAIAAGDIDTYASMLAPDHLTTDHRSGALVELTAGELVETLRLVLSGELGEAFRQSDPELITTRSDNIGLFRAAFVPLDEHATARVEFLAVNKIDDEDRLLRSALFDPEQVEQAYDLLDIWYAEDLPADHQRIFELAAAIRHGQRTGDLEHMRELLQPDFRGVDHRAASFADSDFEGFLARSSSLHEVAPGFTFVYHAVPRVTADVSVFVIVVTASELGVRWEIPTVATLRDGLLATNEYFDDLDSAIARFDQITADAVDTRTTAERCIAAGVELLADGNFDAWAPLLDPGYTNLDRRPTFETTVDAASAKASVQAMLRGDLGTPVRPKVTIVATRGEHRALVQQTWFAADSPDRGSFGTSLMVVEFTEAQLVGRAATFELDQHQEALDLLDEWYADSLDPPARRALELSRTLTTNHRRGDLDAIRAVAHAQCTIIDHRRASFGEIDLDEFLATISTLHETTPGYDLIVRVIREVTAVALAAVVQIDAPDGSSQWDVPITFEIRDDRIFQLEFFDSVSEAIKHAATLSASVSSTTLATGDDLLIVEQRSSPATLRGNEPRTLAEQWTDDGLRLLEAGDWQAWAANLAPDFTNSDRRPLFGAELDRAGAIENLRMTISGEVGVRLTTRIETVARRGEYLLLFKGTWTDRDDPAAEVSHETYTVTEFAADGSRTRLAMFDETQLAEAYQVLDEWHLESLSGEPARDLTASQRFSLAQDHLIAAGEWEAWSEHLADDFVSYDNRALVQSVFDREQSVETIRLLVSDELGRTFVSSFDSLETRGEYHHLGRMNIVDREDADVEVGMLIVDEWAPDGRRLRSATFDPPDLDAATDLLDRWHRESGSSDL